MSTPHNALVERADRVTAELKAQDDQWGCSGWTRRRFLAGAGMVGVAALGSQLVTSRAAYAATPSTGDRTVVVVFLRGAADGLRVLMPDAPSLGSTYLHSARPDLVLARNQKIALPGTGGWALNSKLAPLYDSLWKTGELAFVPAVSASGVSRSHFDAQQYLEKGGDDSQSSGWLDRTLDLLGPGTMFRAVAEGATAPLSLIGDQRSLALTALEDFEFPGYDAYRDQAQSAVERLYRGMGGTLGDEVPSTLDALGTAARIRATKAAKTAAGVHYSTGSFGSAMKDLAQILKAEVGLQVATVDVGGWDTHTAEVDDLDSNLADVAANLQAFMKDLGPSRRSRVTVVVMSEFGRRVAQNGSGGADHGHGQVYWLLGGGLRHSGVFGAWRPLSAAVLDQGDVPGLNNPFDVLGEVVQQRLGAGSLTSVFPGHTVDPLGILTS